MRITASSEHQRQRAASPLLRSKLRRPRVPEYFVVRPRLEAVLATVPTRPLTLVIAPAGSGKTQLLSNWAAHTTTRVAWLSLEETDGEPVVLWNGILAALDQLAPGGVGVAKELMLSGAPIDEVATALLDGLEGVTLDDAVLVLDDVHHVTDPSSAASLALFLQHLPAWLHVIVAGRTDPALPLDRLRIRDQVTELRFAELQFTPDESCEMLARLAPDLSVVEREESAVGTDGWAAGVQLVALSARSAQTTLSPFTGRGSSQLTEHYVWHEVLASGDPDVVDLLLGVSVVDRANGALAAAITERADAHELLVRAEAQGLFVFRLGAEGWFRMHPLVREALRSELVRSGRHRVHHERAARWFEDAGETVHALAQWLLAGRHRDALRLLAARSTELYDQGREDVIARTLEAIPRDVAVTDVPALIDFSVSHILGPRERFVETVRDAMWFAERDDQDHSPPLDALLAISLTMSGDWTRGREAASRAIAALGDTWWRDHAGRFAWNTAARGVALAECWEDDDPFVRDATIAMSRDPLRGFSLEGIRTLGHALAGRPVAALRVAAGVRPAAPTMSILRVELALAEGLALFELTDRERALAALQAIAQQPDEPRLYAPVAAMLALVDAAVDDGDTTTAALQVVQAEELVTVADAGPDLLDWVHRRATTVAILGGDITDARRRANQVTDAFWGPVSRARVALAAGDRAAAAAELATAAPRCPRHEVVRAVLDARAAVVPGEVDEHAARAAELASEHGLLRTLVADGRHLLPAFERAAWRLPEEWLSRLRLAMAPTSLVARLPTRDLPEHLTDRERDVLRLLPSRLTIAEIAKELYVSVNTMKFHLRVIYRKLGVNSREEAATVARSMAQMSSTTAR